MTPVPAGTASCIYTPRLCTSRTASSNARTPAATRAEYSPRLCPAATAGSAPRRVNAIVLTVRSAGWVFRVRRSSSSGPSKHSFEMG